MPLNNQEITEEIKEEIKIYLEINNNEKHIKNTNTWRLNNTLLNDQVITEEIKEEIKKIPRDK